MSWLPQRYAVAPQAMYVPAQVGPSTIIGDISNLISFLVQLPELILLMVMMMAMSMLGRIFA